MPKAKSVLVKKFTDSSACERLWSLRLHRPDAFSPTNNRTRSIVNRILNVIAGYWGTNTERRGISLVYEHNRLNDQSKEKKFDMIWTRGRIRNGI